MIVFYDKWMIKCNGVLYKKFVRITRGYQLIGSETKLNFGMFAAIFCGM